MVVKESIKVLSLFVVQLTYIAQWARTGCMIRVGNHSH